MKFVYETETYDEIKTPKHLDHFLNYLLRTDRGQKWTTKQTERNVIILFDHGNPLVYTGLRSKEERGILKSRAQDILEQSMEPGDALYNDVAETDLKSFHDLPRLTLDLFRIMNSIWDDEHGKGDFAAYSLIFVLHTDQLEDQRLFHVHRLYRMARRKKKTRPENDPAGSPS